MTRAEEGVEVCGLAVRQPVGGAVEAVGVPEEAPAVGEAGEHEVDARVQEARALPVEEGEDPAPQRPDPDDDDVAAEPVQGERLVERPDGPYRVGVGDDGRDRVVAAALGHGAGR